MELIYVSEALKSQCTNIKAAKKLFHGDSQLSVSLLSRINALQQAEILKDIIVQPTFHFHKLKNKSGRNLEGYFAVDVKSRRDQWRIILQPLDENEMPYIPCNIDLIAGKVRIVEISEVSKHYE
ncbi:MAG TPA: hypothetical protein DD414_04010 [Lachnospiraceae bacterium]|nr:hypothetical protein [Lachnospiraceae bacterium]